MTPQERARLFCREWGLEDSRETEKALAQAFVEVAHQSQEAFLSRIKMLALLFGDPGEGRQCRECRKWFEIAPGAGRADKVTCSTACRSKSWRTRKLQANKPPPTPDLPTGKSAG